MTTNELVEKLHAMRVTMVGPAEDEWRSEAATWIFEHLKKHPDPLATLCKKVDPPTVTNPTGWQALESRVIRLREKARSEAETEMTHAESKPTETAKSGIRAGKSAVKKYPELAAQLLTDSGSAAAIVNVIADNPDLVRDVNQAAEKKAGPQPKEKKAKKPRDYNDEYQKHASGIVNLTATEQQGKWEMTPTTSAFRHFLIQALTNPSEADAGNLVAEVEAYLAEQVVS